MGRSLWIAVAVIIGSVLAVSTCDGARPEFDPLQPEPTTQPSPGGEVAPSLSKPERNLGERDLTAELLDVSAPMEEFSAAGTQPRPGMGQLPPQE